MRRVSRSLSTPVPTAGWVTSKNLGEMNVNEALLLENAVPYADRVEGRKGFEEHATGIGSGAVDTLMVYNSPTTSKLLGCGNSAIYDATSSGAVGTALASSLSSNRWQYVNFGTSGSHYIIAVNGEDTPIKYDGSTVSTNSLTGSGLTSSNLISVNEYKERLFFIEKDAMHFWYLAVSSISGALTKFDLAPFCDLGGYLMAMATWTRDGGNGVDDLAVFITSEGEALIYQGNDPSSASDWALVGVFRIGKPVGRRCLMKLGADVVIITQDGFLPLSQVISADRTNLAQTAISKNIAPTLAGVTNTYKNNFGWQAVLHPQSHKAFFNIPIATNQEMHQYVVNTDTGAWCRYKGLNGNCFTVFSDDLYFGGTDGKIYKAETGHSDNGANIQVDIKPAFNYLGSRTSQKHVKAVRPVIISDDNVDIALAINADFENVTPQFTVSTSTSGAVWDVAEWDVAEWAADGQRTQKWRVASRFGRTFSPYFRFEVKDIAVALQSIDWIYEQGGLL